MTYSRTTDNNNNNQLSEVQTKEAAVFLRVQDYSAAFWVPLMLSPDRTLILWALYTLSPAFFPCISSFSLREFAQAVRGESVSYCSPWL